MSGERRHDGVRGLRAVGVGLGGGAPHAAAAPRHPAGRKVIPMENWSCT